MILAGMLLISLLAGCAQTGLIHNSRGEPDFIDDMVLQLSSQNTVDPGVMQAAIPR